MQYFSYLNKREVSQQKYIHIYIYYPRDVRKGEDWGLGVFLLQYFPLVKIC